MRISPPAKINLALQVLGKREDGYHELRTIMTPISLADELELERCPQGITLDAHGCDCAPEANLAYRAARLFFEHTGVTGGVHLRLFKHIPAGSGLGGGSSDAAGTLMALNAMFQTGLPAIELADLAGRLGADCPFFIHGRTMLLGARGDQPLADVDLAERAYLLVIPPFPISTAAVYAGLKIPLTPDRDLFTIERVLKKKLAPEEILFNVLETVAFQLRPELAQIKQDLREAGALGTLMSGSGSTVFGVFDDAAHLSQGMDRIPQRPGYRYLPATRIEGGGIHGDHRGKGVSG